MYGRVEALIQGNHDPDGHCRRVSITWRILWHLNVVHPFTHLELINTYTNTNTHTSTQYHLHQHIHTRVCRHTLTVREAWTHSSSGQRLRSDFWLQYAEDNSEEHYLRMRQSKIGADASLTLSPIENKNQIINCAESYHVTAIMI